MTNSLKQRILTSIILFLILFLMITSNFILVYFLIIFSVYAFIEFTNIISKINIKNKINIFILNFGFLIYVFCFSALLLINFFHPESKILTLIIILICIFSDIGGLIFGKLFKGPKLIKISPNKTLSGCIGSFIFSTVLSIFLLQGIYGLFSYYFILFGIAISFSTQLGDLFFSFLKRKAKLKDTGNILPGHGGVLDRIDGILLGLPTGILTFILL
jgi:phosphatidate cytidylyltransferase